MVDAPALEAGADEAGGLELLEALLGVLVDDPAEGNELFDVGTDIGRNVHGRHFIGDLGIAQDMRTKRDLETGPLPFRPD
jgi:hypothetical protein